MEPMPYLVNWYIENEIIYVYASGVTDGDDFRELLLTMQRFIDSSPRSLVHSITDVGDIDQSVPIKESISILREVGLHERLGWSINLREKSGFVKVGVAIGTSLFKLRTRSFKTLEDAEAFLKEIDPTLSWDRVDRSVLESRSG
jgi:hypothetical protein